MIAPTSPAVTTGSVTADGSTKTLPIVVATWRPKSRKGVKRKNAGHETAQRGVITRVETTVAIEFAASWKPLMKSNASASPTIPQTRRSGILEDDRLDRVRDVFAAVGGGLQLLDHVLPLH